MFRPSSPAGSLDNQEEQLAYLSKQFEDAWQAQLQDSEGEQSPNSYDSEDSSSDTTISSPRVTSTSTSNTLFLELNLSVESMENNWMSEGFFGGLDNVNSFEATANSPAEDNAAVNGLLAENDNFNFDFEFAYQDLDQIFEKGKEGAQEEPAKVISNNVMMSDNSVSDISLASILNIPAPSANNVTVNTAQVHINSNNNNTTRASHQRKAAPGQRVVAPSPFHSHQEDVKPDVKPDVAALGVNNGQLRSSSRKRSASKDFPSTSSSASSNNDGKKKRKYELDDSQDPSVRNAKAAKMNRDRKKKEMEEWKVRALDAEAFAKHLEQEVLELRAKKEKAELELAQERMKNRTSNGLYKNMTNMKDVLEAIVPAVNQKFEKNFTVTVPNSFASIPAALDENNQLVRVGVQAGPSTSCIGDADELNPQNFNILDESFQMPETGSESDTFTLHFNPTKGQVRLDYDPSKLIKRLQKIESSL